MKQVPSDYRNVTEVFLRYRECSRNLWNTYFQELSRPDALFAGVSDFNEIESLLFHKMVIRRAGVLSIDDIRVIFDPTSSVQSLMIERPTTDGNRYWDNPIAQAQTDDIHFRFIEFFDWDQIGWRDCEFYRLRIISFGAHPELVGREALVRAQSIQLFAPPEWNPPND